MNPLNLKNDKIRETLSSITLPINHPIALKLKELSPEDKKFLKDFESIKRNAQLTRKEIKTKKGGGASESEQRLLELIDCICAANPKDPSKGLLSLMEELAWLQDNSTASQNCITPQELARAKRILGQNNAMRRLSKEAFSQFKQWLLEVDTRAINLDPYDHNLLEDPNAGHWDIHPQATGEQSTITFCFPEPSGNERYTLNTRHPLNTQDVFGRKAEVVAIDFGTKSTTAAILDKNSRKILLAIGTLDTKKTVEEADFENPTFMEFYDYKKFLRDYNRLEHRPFTDIADLSISHMAFEHFKEARRNDYYRFFYKLKQWAGTFGNEVRVQDQDGVAWDLGDITDYGAGKPDPIEIYAYLLGRYINNMGGNPEGVHLTYLLSYPAKYEKEQREHIKASFMRGLTKSLPQGIFDPYITGKKENERVKVEKMIVEMKVSEPAAYAISALQAFGFTIKHMGAEAVNYGVFDFGGGTTDFDFGYWQKSADEDKDYDLHHFNEGGAKYLGGENLLELLALEVFKDNMEEVRQNDLVIATPNYEARVTNVHTLRAFIDNKREGRRNLQTIAEELRPFLHGLDEEQIKADGLAEERINLNLVNRQGVPQSAQFMVNCSKLLHILKREIGEVIQNFFEALRVAAPQMKDAKEVHIFLGGNSSRSPLVKMLFEEEAAKRKAESTSEIQFIIYPPLGTPEADALIKERTNKDPEPDQHQRVTCKTGVVFGLLDGREQYGGGINICSPDACPGKDPLFKFYLGRKKGDCFHLILEKEEMVVGEWVEFGKNFKGSRLELYYTERPLATTNELPIDQAHREPIDFDDTYDEGIYQIKIKRINTDSIVVGVFTMDGDSCEDEHTVQLKA
ncbi:Dihydrolipoamide acetyltransferase [Helicobacter sp. NHP19-003]|uniref:Dihydrolipoamide acetyltransferase n=1 Tax=Helicobacter gastrocanis TaxID=2849641 RepID=A0ABM7SBZ5_9HELI|nr:hypothetical protein [Helicobacter sp. NHP19-003]BCZ18185.1 Dihydrolipoamide acetyltransferase [Helicobacter sp. NHP19-003]